MDVFIYHYMGVCSPLSIRVRQYGNRILLVGRLRLYSHGMYSRIFECSRKAYGYEYIETCAVFEWLAASRPRRLPPARRPAAERCPRRRRQCLCDRERWNSAGVGPASAAHPSDVVWQRPTARRTCMAEACGKAKTDNVRRFAAPRR